MFGWLHAVFTGRDGRWPKVRASHLKKEADCQFCGATEELDVHHKDPVFKWPERELDPDNLITLCRHCHLVVGHLGDWKSWNPDVALDCKRMRIKRKNRPE